MVPRPGQPPICAIRAALLFAPRRAPWFPAAMVSTPTPTIDESSILGSHLVRLWSARRAAALAHLLLCSRELLKNLLIDTTRRP
jgi:hypothetical protein